MSEMKNYDNEMRIYLAYIYFVRSSQLCNLQYHCGDILLLL